MEMKLLCMNRATFLNGYYGTFIIREGETVVVDIKDGGIRFLVDDCWSFPFIIDEIEGNFKVLNQ